MATPSSASAKCSRCAAPLGTDRRSATGLAGAAVCERCQSEELDELLAALDRASPGPARPANVISAADRVRMLGTASAAGAV